MIYQRAKKLHTQDEVQLKDCGVVMKVIEIRDIPEEKSVRIVLENGQTVWNFEIR